MTNYITKDQIRKGDTIKVSFEESGGVSVVNTGTAHTKDFEGDWRASSDRYLTYRGDYFIDTIELLSRPMPTEPGAVIRATEIRGEKCDVLVFVVDHSDISPLNYISARSVGGNYWHTSEDITAWDALDG